MGRGGRTCMVNHYPVVPVLSELEQRERVKERLKSQT